MGSDRRQIIEIGTLIYKDACCSHCGEKQGIHVACHLEWLPLAIDRICREHTTLQLVFGGRFFQPLLL